MNKFKRATIVSAVALFFLFAASVTAFALVYIQQSLQGHWAIYLSAGIVAMVASGITAFCIRNRTAVDIACLAVNAVALGLCISAWYIIRGLENNLLTMFLICLACIAVLWVFFFVGLIPLFARHAKVYFLVFLLVGAAVYLVFVCVTKTEFLSTFGYFMLVEAGFIFGMLFQAVNMKRLLRIATLSSYSVFIVAVIIAITALSEEASGLELLTFMAEGETVKNKKNTESKKLNFK